MDIQRNLKCIIFYESLGDLNLFSLDEEDPDFLFYHLLSKRSLETYSAVKFFET
jgi:hypothetical protein